MTHAAPFAVHWQITRTRSWELRRQREKARSASQLVKENEKETLFMGSSVTGSLFLYYIIFLSILKEMAPIARMTHSSDVARDVGLPVTYYVNLLSQHGASVRFQIRPQMWRQRRETAGGGKNITYGQASVLCICNEKQLFGCLSWPEIVLRGLSSVALCPRNTTCWFS